MNMTYNPYPYQPMMRHYYDGAPLPQSISKSEQLVRAQPETAKHVNSLWQFVTWLKYWSPDLYSAVSATRPTLLDPADVVQSGSLTMESKKLRGLFDSGELLFTSNDQSMLATPPGSPSYDYTAGGTETKTGWAADLLDFGKQYLLLDQQKKLLDTNLKRAEKGLPPIDNIGAAVNVGITSDVKNMLMLAIGGVVVVGVVSAMRKR